MSCRKLVHVVRDPSNYVQQLAIGQFQCDAGSELLGSAPQEAGSKLAFGPRLSQSTPFCQRVLLWCDFGSRLSDSSDWFA